MDGSVNGPQKMGNIIVEEVWYEGTDALFEGEGLCYNDDYGTAANFDGRRCNRVERPSATNSQSFAGVCLQDYSAKPAGRRVRIAVPGSKGVNIALAVDSVLGTGLLSFVVAGKYDKGATAGLTTEAGRFYTGKYKGRGSAIPRQTVTAVLESSMTGGWSLAADGITLTVTDTTGLAANDTVVILGGADDATDTLKPGKYLISSITDATTIVLAASAQSVTAGGTSALTCTGYAYTGNPRCQADLLTGDECGGIEFISLPNAGGDTNPYMVGGVSYVCGGVTLAADAEVELAQGSLPGDTKCFILLGTLTTSDFVVDLVSAGLQLDGSTALAEINAIDAAADAVYLEFGGAKWHTMSIAGGAAEA